MTRSFSTNFPQEPTPRSEADTIIPVFFGPEQDDEPGESALEALQRRINEAAQVIDQLVPSTSDHNVTVACNAIVIDPDQYRERDARPTVTTEAPGAKCDDQLPVTGAAMIYGSLARIERELARRASFPYRATDASYYNPCFIPADMFEVERDTEDITDWTINDGQQEQEQEDGDPLRIVAAGWHIIRPGSGPGSQWSNEDDGNQCPAFLPSFPLAPSNGAAALVASEAHQKQEAVR